MPSPDLVEFLLARIAEVEHSAQECDRLGEQGPYELVIDTCAAHRRIVAMFKAAYFGDHADETAYEHARRATLEGVVELLALPYADHPDYRPEWAPAG